MTNTCDPITLDCAAKTASNPTVGRIAGADWDKPNTVRVSVKGSPIIDMTPDEFVSWYRAGAGGVDAVCIERPHLRPRGEYSKAQIWAAAELEQLVGGPPILMPNGKKLHKMAMYAGNTVEEKINGVVREVADKSKDAHSIRRYAEDHPEICRGWKRFVPPSRDRSQDSWEHRDRLRYEISDQINLWRHAWQGVSGKDAFRELDFVRPVAAIVDAIYDDLSEECREYFGMRKSKGTVNIAPGRTRIFTVYASVFDSQGELRRGPTGHVLGRRYLMKGVIGLCDSYMPNMARANLTYYGRYGWGGADKRGQMTRSVRELMRAFQNYGSNQT